MDTERENERFCMFPLQISLTGWDIIAAAGWLAGAYLLGSIPLAWLLVRWIKKQDLRSLGSGNVGVMNTAISISRKAGLLVFGCEIGKGVLAVTIPRAFEASGMIISMSIVGVVAGTRWPLWLGFRGGRGNTAGYSALFFISYWIPIMSLACWTLFWLVLKNTFKASRLTLLMIPIIVGITTSSLWYILAGLALSGVYLDAQRPESDDHLILSQQNQGFLRFLTGPLVAMMKRK
jgi:acyl phosphate:glycerol-3-phosphate acyltransferase